MSKVPSYTGQPPARGDVAGRQRQMAPGHQLQAPGPAGTATPGCQPQAGFSAPGRGPAAVAAAAKRQQEANAAASEEEVVFMPAAHTPRTAHGAAPRRGLGGGQQQPQMQQPQQPLQPQRQFATSLSPRIGNREMKLSIVGDIATTPRDKENCENAMIVKERRESIVKFQENSVEQAKLQECKAKVEELSARLLQKEQAFEQAALTQREAHSLHERLRADLEEARRQARRKEAVEKELHQLDEEKNAHLVEIAKFQEENEDLRAQCAHFEAQNGELQQRVRSLERQQANAERSLSLADKEKQAEMAEKEQRFHELERLLHEKDQRLHEMDCLIHDKDQTLQQLRHENQKQEMARNVQLNDLQVELGEVRRRHQQEREAERKAASRQAEEATRLALEKDTAERAEEAAKRAENKEIRNLRQKLQHQRDDIANLESQLRKITAVRGLMTPGEFGRMASSTEAKNHFSVENANLFARNSELETECALVRKENALLRRRLPTEVSETLRREAAEWAHQADSQPCAEPSP